MADDLIKQVQDALEGPIDFEGQKQTEIISTIILIISGVVAFLAGYIQQNIYVTLWVGLAGAAVAFLAVVPPYPWYNRSPERWLPAGTALVGSGLEVDGKKIN